MTATRIENPRDGHQDPGPGRTVGRRLLRWLLIGLFAGVAIGAVVGLVLSRFVQLPAVEALATFRPSTATQVRARDGSILGSFANERRIPLSFDQIPKVFRDAVIAVEDASFYQHTGIDPKGMLRAALGNLASGRWSEGASTITQQLTREVGLLSREKKLVRKVKEMLLAIEIEQKFSKDQIFTLYANQVNFSHGNYGVEAASRFYFGKHASELTLPEAALLAGIPQRPSDHSPLDHPAKALARRNHVLERMAEERMIDAAACAAAKKAPLGAEAHYDRNSTAEYFIEEVRRSVEDRFGSRRMLEGGLEVETTLDPKLQEFAEDAVREHLVSLQRRLGFPHARRNVLVSGLVHDLRSWRDAGWPFMHWRKGELVYALASDVQADVATLLIAGRTARLDLAGAKWTNRDNLTRLMRVGDVLLVRLGDLPADPHAAVPVELEPEPRVEGSLVAIDNRSGAILALVGGFDFDRSQFDRSMQAKRQVGSAFKTFVYTAAFEQGYSPNDTVFDAPVLLPDEKAQLTYCPLNYYHKFFGVVTFREALEHSYNTSAVKVQQMISGQAVIDVARRLGIRELLAPYPSMALGAFEITPLDLTAAYAGIANRGQFCEPFFISRVKDADGQVVFENRPKVRAALKEDVAYLMTHMLEGVVQRGTAAKANELGAHLAGKTGTTDKYSDAWFIGYSPRITVGTWVGRDLKEPIGSKMTGAEAALPMWSRFMKAYLETQPEAVRNEEFEVPAGVVLVPVDAKTGLRATSACGDQVILEAMLTGHEPAECSGYWHQVVGLPWRQQIGLYTYKPGEPVTTAEAIAMAQARLAGREEGGNPGD